MATFTVSRRAEKGEKPKHLRQKGLVPMSFVDRQHQTHMVKASVFALKEAVKGADSHGVIEVQIEGEPSVRKAMLRSVEGDPLARTVLSATFQEVSDDDLVKTHLPVVAIGHSDAVDDAENAMLSAVTTELNVRGKVSALPDHIEVDVSKLAPGEHISAGDVALPAGVELLSPADAILFTVARIAAPVLESEDLETTAAGEVQASGDAGTSGGESAG